MGNQLTKIAAELRKMPGLSAVERQVIALRFDYNNIHTLGEASAKIGIPREEVRKIEMSLMRRVARGGER